MFARKAVCLDGLFAVKRIKGIFGLLNGYLRLFGIGDIINIWKVAGGLVRVHLLEAILIDSLLHVQRERERAINRPHLNVTVRLRQETSSCIWRYSTESSIV
jgi:hypothetical protein